MRTIPLLPEIVKRLADYREKQEKYLAKNGFTDIGFVFTSTTGTIIEPRDFQRDFKKILKKMVFVRSMYMEYDIISQQGLWSQVCLLKRYQKYSDIQALDSRLIHMLYSSLFEIENLTFRTKRQSCAVWNEKSVFMVYFQIIFDTCVRDYENRTVFRKILGIFEHINGRL